MGEILFLGTGLKSNSSNIICALFNTGKTFTTKL